MGSAGFVGSLSPDNLAERRRLGSVSSSAGRLGAGFDLLVVLLGIDSASSSVIDIMGSGTALDKVFRPFAALENVKPSLSSS